MMRLSSCCRTLLVGWLAVGFRAGAVLAQGPTAVEVGLAVDLKLVEIEPGLWRHVSIFVLASRPTPANGLVLVGEGQALVIDTPWTEE